MTPQPLIRPATLADAPAISAVHCSNIAGWQTWLADGSTHPARYADLTPYQRWLHGGPWLDAGTCADHLERLLQNGGLALVADLNGRVLAEAEMSIADEPLPYGRNMNLAVMYVHRNHQRQGLGSALLQQALALAEAEGCDTFTVAHTEAPGFYARHGLRLAERWAQFRVPAQASKIRYVTEPLPDESYELVQGWALTIGRHQNARHEWERTRSNAAPDFEEWRQLRLERYWITAGHDRAALILEELPDSPNAVNTFLFTQTEYSPNLFTAARDLAARIGFSHLHCLVRSDFKLPDAAATGYTQQLFVKAIASQP